MTHNLKTLRILLIMSILLLAGIASAILLRPTPTGQAQGSRLGGDFSLVSATGPATLATFQGYPSVLYFGYASCPDVCPTSLAVMAQGFRRLDEDQQTRVRGIFVSVDPQRDTPEALSAYSAFFHPSLVGLTGSRAQIDAITQSYGAYYRISEQAGSALGYTVDHSSRLYLLDGDGQLLEVLSDSINPDELAAKLRALL
ncbi:SCO family protein [Marinobacterium rhizophilum]|uniref:SCO family protein n=1 Tax=Marinobacterium rhizophilum TaxID=420402 RepID=A0ABY5HNQ6_9GAMM|nr:SCO family protein [Marinobacterium rhizophilum]UTW13589.1 SCO family protein [Marinobacterium rhizophilum]